MPSRSAEEQTVGRCTEGWRRQPACRCLRSSIVSQLRRPRCELFIVFSYVQNRLADKSDIESNNLARLAVDGVEEDESIVDGGLGAVRVIEKLSRARLPALYDFCRSSSSHAHLYTSRPPYLLCFSTCSREDIYWGWTDGTWSHRTCCRYGAVDVLVQPSRGEGWGLPMVEAMACGTPVIGTRWSGPAEFLTEDNGYPLRTDGLVPNHEAVCQIPLLKSCRV